MEHKKGRTKNFTESEKMLLIELVQERCKILENKTTNSVSIKEKEDCWEDLRMEFMSRSKGIVRTIQSLKTCWENIKKRTKKQYAEEKQAIYKTGGGQYKAISDPIAEQVREIIKPSIEGLSNLFDNDCIAGFENTFDRNEELIEEWLDEGVTEDINTETVTKNVTEDITESVIEDEDGIERDKDGTNDDEYDTEEDVVLNFLKKKNLSWKNWNPQKLQTQISTPHITSTNKRKSATFMDHSASSQNKRSKENNTPSALKGTTKTTINTLKKKNNNGNNDRLAKFGTLADNKIELVNLMKHNGKEKHEVEIEILKKQLQKEELQVLIMQKELELKTLILEREHQRI